MATQATYTKLIDQAAAAQVRWHGGSVERRRPQKDDEVAARFDFETVSEPLSLHERVHDAFETTLIVALTWIHDPEALLRDRFIRQRRPVWMSVNALRRLHGG